LQVSKKSGKSQKNGSGVSTAIAKKAHKEESGESSGDEKYEL